MISAVAVTLALAFWAPYNHGQPVCPNGVQFVYEQNRLDIIGTAWVEQEDMATRTCRIHVVTDLLTGQQIPYQCSILAQEIGHAAFGLPDDAAGGIMDNRHAIPGVCYPPPPPHRAQPRRARPCGTLGGRVSRLRCSPGLRRW